MITQHSVISTKGKKVYCRKEENFAGWIILPAIIKIVKTVLAFIIVKLDEGVN